jgi:putative MFS transporter
MAWVPWLLGQHGFSSENSVLLSSIMQLGVIPGTLLAAVISDRFERKWLIVAVALGVAAFGIPYGFSSRPVPIIIFGFLVAGGLQLFAPLLFAYTPEAYPTDIRNSGVGLAYGLGRLANAVGPMIIALIYTRYGYISVFVYIAACWIAVAITIGGFGLRTRGQSLEMLSEVAEISA